MTRRRPPGSAPSGALLPVLSLWVCLALAAGCSEGGPAFPVHGGGGPRHEAGYLLSTEDSQWEARLLDAGRGTPAWLGGAEASRLRWRLTPVKLGFVLPEAFVREWGPALSDCAEAYVLEGEDTLEELGRVRGPCAEGADPGRWVRFTEPPLYVWQGPQPAERGVSASVMVRDAVGLFAPRGAARGLPELEGELEGAFFCERLDAEGEARRFAYRLEMRGPGVMRYFDATGLEWLVSGAADPVYKDREEPCDIRYVRQGLRVFSRGGSGEWTLVEEEFREVWEAEGLESGMAVWEGGFGGPDEPCRLARAELPPPAPPPVRPRFDVHDFGAAGDGRSLDTPAVNAAIAACHAAGGGTVVFPPGIYLAGSIHLMSRVTLELQEGAVIRATTDMTRYDPREENPWHEYQDDSHSYFHRSLLWGEELDNVGIVGPGTIDGNDAFEAWPGQTTSPPAPLGWILSTIMYQIDETLFARGPKPIALKSCRNVLIQGVTLVHAPDEAILLTGCDDVLVRGVRAREVRVDGIDLDMCRRATVARCEIRSLDDAICLKSTYALGAKRPCRDILVTGCLVSTFINALKIGTETVGDFSNIAFRDCAVRNLPAFPSFAGLSLLSEDGGALDGVTAAGIAMENAGYPVFVRLGDRLRAPEPVAVGAVRDVRIERLRAHGGMAYGASFVTAVPGSRVEGVRMVDVEVVCKGGGERAASYEPVPEILESDGVYPDPLYLFPDGSPAYGFFCRHAADLAFENLRLGFQEPDRRAAIVMEDTEAVELVNVEAERAPGGAPSVITR